MSAPRKKIRPKPINLALQGGGAHGAYTWGVLDCLLEDDRLAIEGISATSAGAMNAAVLAEGLMEGGREGAREALEAFWRAVSRVGSASPLQPTWLDRWSGNWNMDYSPAYLVFDVLTRMFSPYQFNPFNFNPLRGLLLETIDFERLRCCTAVINNAGALWWKPMDETPMKRGTRAIRRSRRRFQTATAAPRCGSH